MKSKLLIPLTLLVYCNITTASVELGQAEFDKGNLRLAKSILSQQQTSDYQKPLLLARIALRSDQDETALQHLEAAIEQHPNNPELYFAHAEVVAKIAEQASIFSVSGYIKKLKASFIKAVELAPDNREYRSTLIKFYINAPSMFGGDKQAALTHIQALEKVSPFDAFLTRLYLAAKSDKQEEFARLIKIGQQNFAADPRYFYTLGQIYLDQEESEMALNQFRSAANKQAKNLKQEKARYQSLVLIGTLSQQLKRNYDEGQNALQQYLNEAAHHYDLPDKNLVKFRLASIAMAQKKTTLAQRLLNEVITETLSDKLKKKARSALKKLARA
ncbi:tetratricopeptide repeat protein [Pseudoalteromonas sp. PPB1]|uniref:tetratricopeptide repeat protein n=1 Tax=Pseudoalteromonas sp. PPB1 TaxID=2756136 RepID=UPI0018912191|nr:tetratricopeptide repeat protein [Pseudoalteromonas sp. PPB1]